MSVSTWSRRGCKVAGKLIRLRYFAAGNRYLYRPADLDQFLADCTAAREAAPGGYAGDRKPPARVDDGYEEYLAARRLPIRTRR